MKSVVILVVLFLVGCATTASISNLPISADQVDFNTLASRDLDPNLPIWNLKGMSEYITYTSKIEEEKLYDFLKQANQKQGFKNIYENFETRSIRGSRGMRMNEWNSVSGIYYRELDDRFQIYVRVDITQDITGGWKENRAEKIIKSLCNISKICI
ncbi:hypothetical protein [Shewanella marina]|uniref:hypothetical protein n=1 Tax=Shewanella marina TaxID=487319 RepID=UPI0011DC7497|nr:hypothetical protein [Shewanella marina]